MCQLNDRFWYCIIIKLDAITKTTDDSIHLLQDSLNNDKKEIALKPPKTTRLRELTWLSAWCKAFHPCLVGMLFEENESSFDSTPPSTSIGNIDDEPDLKGTTEEVKFSATMERDTSKIFIQGNVISS